MRPRPTDHCVKNDEAYFLQYQEYVKELAKNNSQLSNAGIFQNVASGKMCYMSKEERILSRFYKGKRGGSRQIQRKKLFEVKETRLLEATRNDKEMELINGVKRDHPEENKYSSLIPDLLINKDYDKTSQNGNQTQDWNEYDTADLQFQNNKKQLHFNEDGSKMQKRNLSMKSQLKEYNRQQLATDLQSKKITDLNTNNEVINLESENDSFNNNSLQKAKCMMCGVERGHLKTVVAELFEIKAKVAKQLRDYPKIYQLFIAISPTQVFCKRCDIVINNTAVDNMLVKTHFQVKHGITLNLPQDT